MVVDLFLVYQFIRKLTKPFKDWDAYKLDIIDDKGQVLIKRKEFKTVEQKKSFGIFDLMVLNLKKLLAKVPGGQSKLASYAAALWLIKEYNEFQTDSDSMLTEDTECVIIEESMADFLSFYSVILESEQEEDVAVSNAAIAGLGGASGEPGVTKAQQKKYKKKNLKDMRKSK